MEESLHRSHPLADMPSVALSANALWLILAANAFILTRVTTTNAHFGLAKSDYSDHNSRCSSLSRPHPIGEVEST